MENERYNLNLLHNRFYHTLSRFKNGLKSMLFRCEHRFFRLSLFVLYLKKRYRKSTDKSPCQCGYWQGLFATFLHFVLFPE